MQGGFLGSRCECHRQKPEYIGRLVGVVNQRGEERLDRPIYFFRSAGEVMG